MANAPKDVFVGSASAMLDDMMNRSPKEVQDKFLATHPAAKAAVQDKECVSLFKAWTDCSNKSNNDRTACRMEAAKWIHASLSAYLY